MKLLLRLFNITLIGLCGFIMTNCQNEDTLGDHQILDSKVRLKSAQLKSTNGVTTYLMDLIGMIETMESDESLNKGVANSLIVKLENAIKSIDKDNHNAFNGQMKAFINQIEALVNNRMITIEQGHELINKAKSALILYEESFVDLRDGYEYSVVQIGDQLWMAENLRATIFNDGTNIPLITDNTAWCGLTTPGYCWYNNDLNNKSVYGALYNYYTVQTGKLCPDGWHLPTSGEWLTLANYLGGRSEAGGKLKETGTIHWAEPNTGATNETGFTGLPGGFRSQVSGAFYWINLRSEWWEIGGSNPPNETSLNFLRYDNSELGLGYPMPNDAAKKRGVYIRCIKD